MKQRIFYKLGDYHVEYAKSARSVCRLCAKPIADKELRCGPVEKLEDKPISVPACETLSGS